KEGEACLAPTTRVDYRTKGTKIKPTLTRMVLEYRVELDVYNGPLDLLLYLIKRDELDIYDIPIARITESYMTYVNMLRDLSKEEGLDINVAGDIEDRLVREGRLSLRVLLEGRKSRSEMIGVFLALLELIREKKILVQQEEGSSDLIIDPAPDEHRRTYPQASLHLAEDQEEQDTGETPVVR